MLDNEYVCLVLLLLLNSRKAKTLTIIGLAATVMYQNLLCVLELINTFNFIIIIAGLFSNKIFV